MFRLYRFPTSLAFTTGFSIAAATLLCTYSQSSAQMRTWKDRSGEYEVKAKFISSDKDAVKIETEDGREITIAFDKLSGRDQTYIKQKLERAAEQELKQMAVDFYAAVRDAPNNVRDYLTAAGQNNFDSQRSYFSMGSADPGFSPMVSRISFDKGGESATADYRVQIQGQLQKMQMTFKLENERWCVTQLIGFGRGTKIIMDFDKAESSTVRIGR